MTTNSPELDEARLKELLAICRKAPEGPYFADADAAEDCPDHRHSGLAMVDTGRSADWPIARLCEWPTAKFIEAFDPTTCAALIREVLRLREGEKTLELTVEGLLDEIGIRNKD
jgi:hypothetical protein